MPNDLAIFSASGREPRPAKNFSGAVFIILGWTGLKDMFLLANVRNVTSKLNKYSVKYG